MLDKIKEDLENTPLSEYTSEFNKRCDDALKELEAMAEVANRSYNDYLNAVPSSNYEYASRYYERFTSMWDLRDELKNNIDELNNFGVEEYIEELRNDRIDAETEYKLCVFGRA
jgi:uncharacterized coiled-coil DUF342 family protein